MQKMILFILGIFLIGIAPVFITALFQKKSEDFDKVKRKNNFIYLITLCNLCIFFFLNRNSDILLGTLIGSSLFQLLAVGGVSQLFDKKRNRMDGRGQYLAFCAIVLLFLSADYLLTGNAENNILSPIDGVLLLFLFILYLFICIRNGLEIRIPEKQYIFYFISLEIVILLGTYMISQNVSKIGAAFGLSQYLTGLTMVSWCINISTMFMSKEKNQKLNYLEEAMEETVISITLLLGGIICFFPLSISSYIIYDLIIFGVVSIVLQLVQKIDSRLAASGMATVYVAFIVYVFIR